MQQRGEKAFQLDKLFSNQPLHQHVSHTATNRCLINSKRESHYTLKDAHIEDANEKQIPFTGEEKTLSTKEFVCLSLKKHRCHKANRVIVIKNIRGTVMKQHNPVVRLHLKHSLSLVRISFSTQIELWVGH